MSNKYLRTFKGCKEANSVDSLKLYFDGEGSFVGAKKVICDNCNTKKEIFYADEEYTPYMIQNSIDGKITSIEIMKGGISGTNMQIKIDTSDLGNVDSFIRLLNLAQECLNEIKNKDANMNPYL